MIDARKEAEKITSIIYGSGYAADMTKDIIDLVARVRAEEEERAKPVIEAASRIVQEPDALLYPDKDVYGCMEQEDIDAPLWTECGLYGRVGKEAGRTLLVRHKVLGESIAIYRASKAKVEPKNNYFSKEPDCNGH